MAVPMLASNPQSENVGRALFNLSTNLGEFSYSFSNMEFLKSSCRTEAWLTQLENLISPWKDEFPHTIGCLLSCIHDRRFSCIPRYLNQLTDLIQKDSRFVKFMAYASYEVLRDSRQILFIIETLSRAETVFNDPDFQTLRNTLRNIAPESLLVANLDELEICLGCVVQDGLDLSDDN